jgi:hypothetical protein
MMVKADFMPRVSGTSRVEWRPRHRLRSERLCWFVQSMGAPNDQLFIVCYTRPV